MRVLLGPCPRYLSQGRAPAPQISSKLIISNTNNLCLVIGSGRYSGGSILNLHHCERVRLLLKAGCSSLVIQATGCFPPHLPLVCISQRNAVLGNNGFIELVELAQILEMNF